MKRLGLLVGRTAYYVTLPLVKRVIGQGPVRTRVFVTVGDDILILKNWFGSGGWSLPGGGLHANEAPEAGAARELAEEVGIRLARERLIPLTPQPVVVSQGSVSFKCLAFHLDLKTKPKLQLQWYEIAEARWVPKDQLPAMELGPSAQTLLEALERSDSLLH